MSKKIFIFLISGAILAFGFLAVQAAPTFETGVTIASGTDITLLGTPTRYINWSSFGGNADTATYAVTAGTATSATSAGTANALAANPANCSAGSYPLGIAADGSVESCTVATAGSGDGVWATTTADIYNSNSGNVGIGTSTPKAKLEVVNAGAATSPVLRMNSGLAGGNSVDFNPFITGVANNGFEILVGGTNRLTMQNGGNVGIGTTNPLSKLQVNGLVEASRLGFTGTYDSTLVQGIWSIGRAYQIDTVANTFGNHYGLVYSHTNASSTGLTNGPITGWGHQILFTTNGTRNAVISLTSGNGYFAGNVGIGTTSPTAKLEVRGATGNSAIKISGNTDYQSILYLNGTGSDFGKLTFDDSNNNLYLQNESSGGSIMIGALGGSGVWVDSSNNVGIGTISPTLKLDVAADLFNPPASSGTTNNGFMRIGYTDRVWAGSELNIGIINAGAYPVWFQAQNPAALGTYRDISLNPNGGNVGIGTTTPLAKLEIKPGASGYGQIINGGASGSLRWGSGAQGALSWDTGKAIVYGLSGNALSLGADGTWDKLVIATTGNVGIGTTAPAAN